MKRFIKQLFCSHPRLSCIEYSNIGFITENIIPETRIVYSSPWSLFGTKETKYHCTKCGKKFWYAKGNMDWEKMNEQFLKDLQTQQTNNIGIK